MFKAGFAREIITPKKETPLCGYFNPRPNAGVLDDLFVRVVIFKKDQIISGLVVFDLCLLSTELIDRIKNGISAVGMSFGSNLIFSVTHTHTGPYTYETYGVKADNEYIDHLIGWTVSAIRRAYANVAPAELFIGSEKNNPFAFNRRYWMTNDKVLTNPGKLNPEIVKPEGTVDTEIGVLAVKQDGRIIAILANIINHSDTIGDDLISGDWPGRMERAIQNLTGYDVPVLTLLGCSGNINHLDVTSITRQSSYAEACRIGTGYAEIITGILPKLNKISTDKLQITSSKIDIPFQIVSQKQSKQAKSILTQFADTATSDAMTSEGLAAEDGAVAKFFAEQLLEYQKKCSRRSREFSLISLKIGNELALTTLPGEPFTEIGLKIKRQSSFPNTWPVTLAMGYCGYLPLLECFEHGGYEPRPVVGGCPAKNTADRLVKETLKNLK